jgi:hypothetical protein
MRQILFVALGATLMVLGTSNKAQAWGAYHVGYTHVGYGGAYHYGRTGGYSPYRGYSSYGSYGYRSDYRSPYYSNQLYPPRNGVYGYGGYHYGGYYGGGYGAGVYRAW